MGAEYHEGYGLSNVDDGLTAGDAFAALAEAEAWEYGHGGYTGTFAETPGCVLLGKLPSRVTSTKFAHLIAREKERRWYGYWDENVYSIPNPEHPYIRNLERTIKHRTVKWPKSMQTPEMIKLVEKFIDLSEQKWEPAAAVECNDAETREYKKAVGKPGTRGRLFFFAATCSS